MDYVAGFVAICGILAAFFGARQPETNGTRFVWTLPALSLISAASIYWVARDSHQFPLLLIMLVLTSVELTQSVRNTARKRGFDSVDAMVRDKAKQFQ